MAGLRVAPRTQALLAPIELVVAEEPLAREKMCPVLAVAVRPDAGAAIKAAQAVLRIAGAGHSAAIHSTNPDTVFAFADAGRRAARRRQRAEQHGRRRLRHPPGADDDRRHRLRRPQLGGREPRAAATSSNWSRVAYAKDAAVPYPDYAALRPWERRVGVPPRRARSPRDDASAALREQIRRLVLEELRELVR